MDATFIKPKIGEACNGCGLCCKMRVCYNGAFVQRLVDELGKTIDGQCPALTQQKDGSYACGIVLNPKKYIKNRPYPEDILRKNFAHLIGAGYGCDELGYEENQEEEAKLMLYIEGMKNDPNCERKTKIALKVIYGIE